MVHKTDRSRIRRAQRMEAILDAAMEILLNEGLEALTVPYLAERLGYSRGALYRYFDAKDAILAALQTRVVEGLYAYCRRMDVDVADALQAMPAGTGILARALAGADAWLAFAEAYPEQAGLMLMTLSDPRELIDETRSATVFALGRRVVGLLETHLQRCADHKLVAHGDLRRRAVALWAQLMGTIQLGKLRRFDPDLACTTRPVPEGVAALFAGWGASAPHLHAARAKLADCAWERFDADARLAADAAMGTASAAPTARQPMEEAT